MVKNIFTWRIVFRSVVVLIALVASLMVIVLCFGGALVSHIPLGGSFAPWLETWHHGWPFEYLRRQTEETSTRYEVWLDPVHFNSISLAGDCVICLAIQGTIFLFAYRVITNKRYKRSTLSFSLGQLLVGVTITCLVLGSLSKSLATSKREKQFEDLYCKHFPSYDRDRCDFSYIGPIWLSRLAGDERYKLSRLSGITTLRLSLRRMADGHIDEKLLKSLASLQHLKHVDLFSDQLTDDELKSIFSQWKHLRLETLSVYSSSITGTAFVDAHCLQKLEAICISGSAVDDQGFANLAGIPSLEVIDASSTQITSKSLSTIRQMPHLTAVGVHRTHIRPEDCGSLRTDLVSFDEFFLLHMHFRRIDES